MRTIITFAYATKEYVAFEVIGSPIYLHATNFANGIVRMEASEETTIYHFARLIEGCFAFKSNFRAEICKGLGLNQNTNISGIECVFEGKIIYFATKENANKNDIIQSYNKKAHVA